VESAVATVDGELGEVIAMRYLYLVDDPTHAVVVQIGRPEPLPDGRNHSCAFRVLGLGSGAVQHVGGVDSLQALQLAIDVLTAYLHYLNASVSGRLRWKDDDTGDLGLGP
jgi:uncharacterized protein DUF6968